VTRLGALVADFILVIRAAAITDDSLLSHGSSRGGKAIPVRHIESKRANMGASINQPGHMVKPSTLEALDGRKRRGVQSTAWGWGS